MKTCIFAAAAAAALLLCLAFAVNAVEARACRCNFGGIARNVPACECECDAGFLPPSCLYKTDEDVRLDVYLNRSLTEFTGDIYLALVNENALTTQGRLYGVVQLTRFGYLNVVTILPGFAVKRFTDAVWVRQPWVQRYNIESAYVIARPFSPRSSVLEDVVIYEKGKMVITVDGMLWLIMSLVLIFLLMFIESCCFDNVEEIVADLELADKHQQQYKGKEPVKPHTGEV